MTSFQTSQGRLQGVARPRAKTGRYSVSTDDPFAKGFLSGSALRENVRLVSLHLIGRAVKQRSDRSYSLDFHPGFESFPFRIDPSDPDCFGDNMLATPAGWKWSITWSGKNPARFPFFIATSMATFEFVSRIFEFHLESFLVGHLWGALAPY